MTKQRGVAATSGLDVDVDRPVVVSVRRLATAMAAAGVVLVAAHSVAHVVTNGFDKSKGVAEVVRLFDMNREASLPTWYSQTLLLVSAVLAFGVAHLLRGTGPDERGAAGARSHRSDAVTWRVIGVALLLAAIDEGAGIHERFDSPVRSTIGSGQVAWIIPYSVIAMAMVALIFPFWRRLPRPVRALTAAAAVLYVLGAVGLEAIGDPSRAGASASMDAFLTLAEETLEVAGASVFIYALAVYLEALLAGRPLRIRVVA